MARQPRILWLMADELRTDALGCYGGRDPRISTPAIDAIAERGTVFERCYTTSPICVPARAAMLSGMSPLTTGVLDNEAHDAPSTLPESFTETLARAGWQTMNFGKEHLPGGAAPWQRHVEDGSEMSAMLDEAAAAGSDVRRVPGIGHVYSAPLPAEQPFSSSAITHHVIRAIQDTAGPFLIRASYLQPHRPAVVPEPWASRYADIDFTVDADPVSAPNEFERRFGLINRGSELPPGEMDRALRMYYGAVAWLDDQIAAIMAALEETGLRESTIIIVSTDHGAIVGEHGGFGKHTFAPASHRVPLIISDPGQPPGSRRADLATSEDLAATILGLAGVPASHPLDGRDLFADPAPRHIGSAIGYGSTWSRAFPNRDVGSWHDGRGWPQRACVRTDRYRLDGNTRIDGQPVDVESPEGDLFLADSSLDPTESTNVVDDPRYAHIRAELVPRLRELQLRLDHASTLTDRVAPSGKFTLS